MPTYLFIAFFGKSVYHGELGALINPDDINSIAKTIIDILQYQYDNKLIYQPENLPQKVIDIYGFK